MGSGFLLSGGRILTNAHVVSDARQIIIRRNGDNTPYFARVDHIAHDADLAMLRVDDAAFARDVTPLRLGDLPSLRTRVRTYGFPSGGDKISRTEGVVSRVEFVSYLHSGADAHLAIQTDSAINPGNSGGPVIQDNRVVGVAFQTSTRLNDVGFFIPTPVIRRFLHDIADGTYDGYAELGVNTSNLYNPAYRDYLRLPDDAGGVVVDRVLPNATTAGHLREDDVILSVDGVPVKNDGTIDYGGHTVAFAQVAEQKQIGDAITLTVWREGARKELRPTMQPLGDVKRIRKQYDALPHYVVYAGLVFMPLTREYLHTFGNFREGADDALLYEHFFAPAVHPEAERPAIVLTRVLPHPSNSPYRRYANSIVERINGQAIHALADVPAALQKGEGDTLTIVLKGSGSRLVLDRERAREAHRDTLERYGIRNARRLP